jgi:uncharacterized protein YlxP (DUF503 family)
LFLADNESLKGKRAVVRSLLGRVRAKFNVAAAEVGELNAHEHAELAFAVVSNDARHANGMLDTIAAFCEHNTDAQVASTHVELVPMGKSVGSPMIEPESLPKAWRTEPEQDD